MLPPNRSRGLLGNFLCGTDPLTTDQCASPLPVRLLTSSSLQAILAAGAGGRSMRGGAKSRKSPRDGGGWGWRSRGEEQVRRRGNERRDGGRDEDNDRDKEDDDTGARKEGFRQYKNYNTIK